MRSGRPAYHIKAKFLTVFDLSSKTLTYFELDNKGNLKKDEKGKFSSFTNNMYETNKNINISRIDSPKIQEKKPIENDIPKVPENKQLGNDTEDTILNDGYDNSLDLFDFEFNDDTLLINDSLDFMPYFNIPSEDLFIDT